MQLLYDEGQARRFLAATIVWPDESIDGVVNIVARAPNKKNPKKTFWSHIGVKDIDEAIKAIHHLGKRGCTDVYVWMALGLPNAEPFPTKGNWQSLWLKGNRLAENAAWFKSVFLDIDAGPAKHYKTLPEVVHAIHEFLGKSKLPKPSVLVNSGHGFHLHWTFDEPLAPERWLDLGRRLVAAVKQHGLECDTACTIDRARILRVPGTWNNKDAAHPVKVELKRRQDPYFVDAIAKALESYQPVAAFAAKAATGVFADGSTIPPRAPAGGAESMAEGIEREPLLVDIDLVAGECPMIRDALATGGAGHSNPLWHQLVYLSTFVMDGEDIAHWLSYEHPSYTVEETEQEYARALKTRESHPELGWTKCATLHNSGSKHCQECPHFSEGKSPLNYGITSESNPRVEIPEDNIASEVEDRLPPRYARDPNSKIIYESVTDESGATTKHAIFPLPIMAGYLSGETARNQFNFSIVELDGTVRPIQIPTGCTSASGEFKKEMHGRSITSDLDTLRGLFVPWIDQLRNSQYDFVDRPSFGWVVANGKVTGFTFAGETWSPKGRTPAPPIPGGLASQYEPMGGADPWKAAAKLITDRQQPELDTIVATAFAAPLVRFIGERGLQLYPWSQGSGVGKTSALRVAAAVWGHPVASLQATNDTENSVLQKMKDIRNLPVLWDEIRTQQDIDRFVNMVFNQAQGKNKSRLRADTSYQVTGTWQTLMVCCSNTPLTEVIAQMTNTTTAGVLRVIEYEITKPLDPVGMVATGEADTVFNALNENYGVIGRAYAHWLGQNFNGIEKDVLDLNNRVETWLLLEPHERFWRSLLVVLALGARYARALGFAELDEDRVTNFVADQIDRARGIVKMSHSNLDNVGNLKDILTNFRADMQARNTVVFSRIWMQKGKPAATFYANPPPSYDRRYFDQLIVAQSDTDNLLRINLSQFELWLKNHGYRTPYQVIKQFSEHLGARPKYDSRLAPGFDKDPGPMRIIEFDLTGNNADLKEPQ